MGIYSNSKLGTFDQCKYKFRLQYIERIRTGVRSIEAFMGSMVHDTLEKLYKDSSWYDSKPVQDSITNFMEKFLKTNPNWVEEWKTFFSEYVKR